MNIFLSILRNIVTSYLYEEKKVDIHIIIKQVLDVHYYKYSEKLLRTFEDREYLTHALHNGFVEEMKDIVKQRNTEKFYGAVDKSEYENKDLCETFRKVDLIPKEDST